MPSNDNGQKPRDLHLDRPDAHGHAALLLVESLIHGLMERSVLTTGDVMGILETAIDVQAEFAEAAVGSGQQMWRSYALLSAIAASLRYEIADRDEQAR